MGANRWTIYSQNFWCLWLNLCLTFYRMYYICRNVYNFVNFKTIFSEFYLLNINLFLVINRLKYSFAHRLQRTKFNNSHFSCFIIFVKTYFFLLEIKFLSRSCFNDTVKEFIRKKPLFYCENIIVFLELKWEEEKCKSFSKLQKYYCIVQHRSMCIARHKSFEKKFKSDIYCFWIKCDCD